MRFEGLRQEADRLRPLGARKTGEILAIEPHMPRRRHVDTGKRAQERRLARAVGADHGHRAARSQHQRYAIDQGRALAFHGERFGGERAHVRSRRASSRMKNGPPAMAVTRPSGISAGGKTARAIASASVTTIAPTNAEAGNNGRCNGPTSQRAMWGAASPTNATSPPNATAAATITEPASTASATTRRVSRPKAVAMVSPRPKRSRRRANNSERPRQATVIATSNAMPRQLGVWMPPSTQLITTCRLTVSSESASIRNKRNAPRIAATATPASSSPAASTAPATRAMPSTSIVAPQAPAKASTGSSRAFGSASGTSNATVAPTAAPPADPSRYGSASGLRNTPW